MIYNREKLLFEISKLEATQDKLAIRRQDVQNELNNLQTSIVEINGAIKGIRGLISNIDKVEQAEKLKSKAAKKVVKVPAKK